MACISTLDRACMQTILCCLRLACERVACTFKFEWIGVFFPCSTPEVPVCVQKQNAIVGQLLDQPSPSNV